MGSLAKASQLKSDDPHTTQWYLKHLQKHCKDHNLFTKIQNIANKIQGPDELTPATQYKLNVLDSIRVQGMLWAERQCHKLHTHPYGWTPAIMQSISKIKYWRYTLKQHHIEPTNAHYMVWLAQQLSLPTTQPEMTEIDIKCQIKEAKQTLWQLLGDPNWRAKWLENLAGTQWSISRTDPSKCLCHLQWTEEQSHIARQIRHTNQTHWQAGGSHK